MIIRVNRTNNYTVMSNYHFKEKQMSLKAKGLLSLMLSLPDDWDYSIDGLITLSKDGKDSVMNALIELEKFRYLKRTKLTNEKGQFAGYDYDIYEKPYTENPQMEKPCSENPNTENPNTENPPQLNTNKLNTYELNTNELNKEKCKKEKPSDTPTATHTQKHKYGEYKNVLLTDEEYNKIIVMQDGKEAIEYLSEYIEMKGYKARSHYLCILKWVFNALKEQKQRNQRNQISQRNDNENKPLSEFDEWLKNNGGTVL